MNMDTLNRLSYFVLQFKTENQKCTEGIYALNLSHAKDRLMLNYPEATDIHHITDEYIANPVAVNMAETAMKVQVAVR
jgi:hypothetical protein